MLLAVPLTMMLKVVLDGTEEFRWIGVAISSETPRGNSHTQRLQISPGPGVNPGAELENG
jgi:hypothetical protein